MAEYGPTESINNADLRLTTPQLIESIYGPEAPEIGANATIYEILTKQGYCIKPQGSGDDVKFVWLFKNKVE